MSTDMKRAMLWFGVVLSPLGAIYGAMGMSREAGKLLLVPGQG